MTTTSDLIVAQTGQDVKQIAGRRRVIVAAVDLPHIPAPEAEIPTYDDALTARRAARAMAAAANALCAYCWLEDHAFSWLRDQWRADMTLPPGITSYTMVYADHYAVFGDDGEFQCRLCGRVVSSHRGYRLQRVCVACAEGPDGI